jgi:hypothetical protein
MGLATSDIDQISAMRMGVDYSFLISLRKFSLRVRPLSIMETIRVAQDVNRALAEMPEEARIALSQHTLIAKETIKLASTSDVGATDFKITDLIMDRMTPDEMQLLFKQYTANCDRVNPCLDLMSRADIQALVDDLKKNAKTREDLALRLIELSLSQLHNLALFSLTADD